MVAAAFGRLCVETIDILNTVGWRVAAAFGRLCVETKGIIYVQPIDVAAAFGRLCVETLAGLFSEIAIARSRLRAAVC